MTETGTSPYLLEDPPTSVGRVLLSRAFTHWCLLHHGLCGEELAEALDPAGYTDSAAQRQVKHAAMLLGELIAGGEMHSWSRPMGGGNPVSIPAAHWELDDFRARVAASAFDPSRPYDDKAEPTHWIFLELADFNRVVELSCADILPTKRQPGIDRLPTEATGPVHDRIYEERHIRMPEVIRRTGMSVSTVYRRIAEGRFPKQIPMSSGNIASWRESEVADWIASPR